MEKVTCEDCWTEYPKSEVDDETDYYGEKVPDRYIYRCYECKHPFDDFY
jgi:DNA-directed RNA polymerase subunit RPC12/RpoP